MTEERASPMELPLARVRPGDDALLVVDVQNDFLADGGWFAKHGQDLTRMRRAVDDRRLR